MVLKTQLIHIIELYYSFLFYSNFYISINSNILFEIVKKLFCMHVKIWKCVITKWYTRFILLLLEWSWFFSCTFKNFSNFSPSKLFQNKNFKKMNSNSTNFINELYLTQIGSTWILDSLYLFLLSPISFIGFILNLNCLRAIFKKRKHKIAVFSYMYIH